MITELIIRGLVQGVGFRPFIYHLAKEMGVKGTVSNCSNGVIIRADIESNLKEIFINRIKTELPTGAFIHSIDDIELLGDESYDDFSIIDSVEGSEKITQVAPDMVVCSDCLKDRYVQPHRKGYPFINCTHCGPRFTIIKDLPYDRVRTTMKDFEMCEECRKEYTNISDRRFHAQPIACNDCGPTYYTTYYGAEYRDYAEILDLTSSLINAGKVIAAKGVGGYHLICDATNEKAVSRLREIKQRDTKPFAVMFCDMDSLKGYTQINETEAECLFSYRRPIVLLRQIKSLAKGVNEGMKTLGCMLPYMPIHDDWFEKVNTSALVMTSGNISDLPIAITPEEAESQLKGKVDLILHHNRDIYNRADDSVLQVCGGQPCLIRRSRGYVPEPFFTDTNVEGILAFGAEKVNTFSLGKEDTIIQSQYIGDLKNWETYDFYQESLERFRHLFRFTPSQLVCDLHPDYLSTREAENMKSRLNLPLLKVQHHHAHAVACMLEYSINEPVIAVVWDGTGSGDDGKAWGGEFFLCDRKEYTRTSHFNYIPMPGGDKASLEPWRMAVAYLHHYKIEIPYSFIKRVGKSKVDMVRMIIDKGINTPYTSAVGRLFDALASIVGLCDTATRQAEAPVLLEQCAEDDYSVRYDIDAQSFVISVEQMLRSILEDMEKGMSVEKISAKIHNSLAYLILDKVKILSSQSGINKVVISGGCFQNKRLVEHLQRLFQDENISLYIPSRIPCNDGGISVGQAAIAAARTI
ncbi:MAG: carbamoyltransferase HypF [Dysgonomonas sp.]|nr:carbamoyltransferase HypF [Dysgonomonas sp.]